MTFSKAPFVFCFLLFGTFGSDENVADDCFGAPFVVQPFVAGVGLFAATLAVQCMALLSAWGKTTHTFSRAHAQRKLFFDVA